MSSSRPDRHRGLTRLGFHFIVVGTFAMLGGALRGFNLLLVLAGLLIGALVVQWRWSKRSVEAIRLERRLPGEAFAGRPFRVRYKLHNWSRFIPAWMIRVEDRIQRITTEPSETVVAACGAGVIAAGKTVVPHFDCLIQHRGSYRVGPATISTTFPFALMTARRPASAEVRVDVFPRLLTLRAGWRKRLLSRTGGVTVTARRSGPSEGEFFGLREWQTGDHLKWIHWRTTARLGEPAVRQFEQQRRFDSCLLLDGYSPQPISLEYVNQEVETAISLTATLIVNLVSTPANRIALALATESTEVIVAAGGGEAKQRMLSVLAGAQPAPEPQLIAALAEAQRSVGQQQDLVVISPRTLKDAVAMNPELPAALQPWTRRNALLWIDVSGRAIEQWVLPNSAGQASAVDRQEAHGVSELGEPASES